LSAFTLFKEDHNCAFYILPCALTAEFLNSQEEPQRDAVLFDLALFTTLADDQIEGTEVQEKP
jgi:hypothetical protein